MSFRRRVFPLHAGSNDQTSIFWGQLAKSVSEGSVQEQTPLSEGMVIRGQYIVECLLGRSSSCATYLVRDQRARDAECNLFVLKEVVEPNKKGRRRRASESKSLKKLHHPGLPRVHRVLNDDKNSRVYLLMDCIAGEDLETLRQQQPVKLFPWPQVMTIIDPLLAAVTYLHDQRTPIIHGDIKPGNIIMSSEDTRIVLVDFGLSKVGDPPDLTTPADRHCYLAPEQYSGIIDVRTDIYALGATCYTLVTGKVPPDARSRLKQIDDEAIDPLVPVNDIVPAVPIHVGKAIERAMSLDAQRRFSSVEQFREALWLLVGRSAPVFGVSPVLKDSPTVPAGGLERAVAVGQASEKPLSSPPAGGPAQESAEEPEDPDATIRLPKLPLVKRVRESAEKREDPGPDNSLPKPPSAGLAEIKEPGDLGAAKLLPRPSRDGRSSFSLGKPGVLFVVLPLLISLGIGAGFMSLAQSHSAPKQSHAASPASTPTSAPAASSYPTLAGIYTGTIYDIPANVTTKMSLTGIQQTHITISGNFTGLHRNGTFNGNIDPSKHLQFTVKDSAGHLMLSFDGDMQSSGDLSGSYCSVDQDARCTGEYGVWSVAPAS